MIKKRIDAPDWLLKLEGITNRQWKAKKRAELNEVINAFAVYRVGCSYCPVEREIEAIESALKKLKSTHSAKSWGH